MLRAQVVAGVGFFFRSAVGLGVEGTSFLAFPFYDYHLMTIILRVCLLVCKKTMKEYIPIELIDEAYRDCCKHKGGTEGCLEYKMNYLLNNL